MTQDRNKGISGIAYNHLNLPRLIHFGTGADSLVFRYSAAGQKVAKLVYQTGKATLRTDYLGPLQYEQDSLRFFPHAEGRVLRFVNTTSGDVRYAREFTLKDHLGNLRLAYRAGQCLRYTAGMEPGEVARESQQFDSLSVMAPIAQRAPTVGGVSRARTGAYVAWLNAAPHPVPGPPAATAGPTPLGPLKQLAVQQGDTVTVTAPGYYPQPVQSSSFAFSLATFVAGLLQQQPPTPSGLDGGGRTRPLPLLSIGISAGLPALVQASGGVPKGYVRLLVFDADSNLVSSQTRQLSSAARTSYEPLSVQVIAPQDGYVTAYVGNESNADVYFDDVTIEHRQGLQVQENQYDPFGLDLAGVSEAAVGLRMKNFYQFNGKENQLDLGLNWNHQDWRFYDYQIGRWNVIDPLSERGRRWTPYDYAFDNPIKYTDPDGLWPTWIHNKIIKRAFKDDLSKEDIKVLQQASLQTDKKEGAQEPDHAPEHYMRGPKQDPLEAEQKSKEFIQDRKEDFKSKDGKEALYALGEGMHTIMDGTSPSHKGSQPWAGVHGVGTTLKAVGHIVKELNLFGVNNKEIKQAQQQIRAYYQQAVQEKQAKK